MPTVNLSGRYGITDRFDLGGRFGTSLIELHGKVMFTDPADPEALQIAFAPQLGGIFVGAAGESAGYGWLNAPVLFDIPVGQHDIVVGPRVHTTFAGGGGGGGVLFSIGSSIGFAAKVGNTARILPELAVVVPLAGSISGGGTDFLGGGVIYTVNLGILLGGRDHSASE